MKKSSQLAVAGCFLLLATVFALGIRNFPAETGYAGIGSRFFPSLIASLLTGVGLLLSWQALRGGFRNLPPNQDAVQANWVGGLWVSAGILLHALLITKIGFVLAACLLFSCVARGFGSRNWLPNGLIALVVVLPVFWLFTLALDVNLPHAFNRWF